MMTFRLKINFDWERYKAIRILNKYIYVTMLAEDELAANPVSEHSDKI